MKLLVFIQALWILLQGKSKFDQMINIGGPVKMYIFYCSIGRY